MFIKEKEDQLKSLKYNAHYDCGTNDEWQVRRGVLATLDQILSLEDATRISISQSEEEDYEL